MCLRNAAFGQPYGTGGTVVVWLNLRSREDVDELYHRWREDGAKIMVEPEDKPWHLREFRVAALDGNQLRVLYDFSSESRPEQVSAGCPPRRWPWQLPTPKPRNLKSASFPARTHAPTAYRKRTPLLHLRTSTRWSERFHRPTRSKSSPQ